MDTSKVTLVVCLTLFIVVGVNAALLVALRRGKEASQVDLLKRAAARARQPWVHEDEALQELSRRVSELKGGRAADTPNGVNRSRTGSEGQADQDEAK